VATRTAPRPGTVHIWRAPLDLTPEAVSTLASSLSEEEHERADSLRGVTNRDRFIARRAWVRHILGEYLNAEPSALKFRAGAYGKPLLDSPEAPWLRFSASSSAGVAVIAVATAAEVGVDIERAQKDFPVEAVARQAFSVAERRALENLSGDAQADEFFALWTRKEAYLKGVGVGLRQPEPDVEAGASEPQAGEAIGGKHIMDGKADWSLANFAAGAGYVAAVALEGRGAKLPSRARKLAVASAWVPTAQGREQ
jgi:4'-phosphopantetheinyl transferase